MPRRATPALRRARQVVLFGDPVVQKPTPFRVSAAIAAAAPDDADEVPFDETSVFERIAELLPVETLTRSYRAGGEDLSQLVNDAFYGGEIVSLPWAGSYLGRGSLSVDYVEGGVGAPDPVSGAVESPDAEVARVVTLVVEHAVNRASESLMVVTASRKHAERVRASVVAALAGRSPTSRSSCRGMPPSPSPCSPSRSPWPRAATAWCFSLGFGLTRHGRVLSDFGDLSTPDGERLLTVGMTRARRSMVIVSSIRPRRSTTAASSTAPRPSWASSATSPPAAARAASKTSPIRSPARWRGSCAASASRSTSTTADSFPSSPATRQGGGGRERSRDHRGIAARDAAPAPADPAAPRWHYVRVHAFDLYSDPAGVAARIAELLGVAPDDSAAPDATTESLDLPG